MKNTASLRARIVKSEPQQDPGHTIINQIVRVNPSFGGSSYYETFIVAGYMFEESKFPYLVLLDSMGRKHEIHQPTDYKILGV